MTNLWLHAVTLDSSSLSSQSSFANNNLNAVRASGFSRNQSKSMGSFTPMTTSKNNIHFQKLVSSSFNGDTNAIAAVRRIAALKPIAKAKDPVDHDGDGMVFDETDEERPAKPSEQRRPGKRQPGQQDQAGEKKPHPVATAMQHLNNQIQELKDELKGRDKEPGEKERPADGESEPQKGDAEPKEKRFSDTLVSHARLYANEPTVEQTKDEHWPDPEFDYDNDGLTDSSRVGVPGDLVPPPPERLPRLPNLTDDEYYVQESFSQAFESDPDGMAEDYRKKVYTGEIGDGPKVFNTDDAKLLSPHYNQSLESRAMYNAAVHQTANAIAKRAFVQHLDEVAKGPEDQKHVLVTAGGVAAGKGHALKHSHVFAGIGDRVGGIWDTAGEQNSTELPWVMNECKLRGIKTTFVYVHADPKQTWTNPKRGVVERAKKKGRMVDARLFAESYAIGSKNFNAFMNKNKDSEDSDFYVLDNTSAKPKQLDSVPVDKYPTADELHNDSVNHLVKSDAPAHIKRGGTVGLRMWSNSKSEKKQNG